MTKGDIGVEPQIPPQLAAAVRSGNIAVVRELVTRYRDELPKTELNYYLRAAANENQVEVMSLLVDFGADIHASTGLGEPPSKEGCIDDAAKGGAIDAVRWLLDRGAKINFSYEDFPGETRCMPLTAAVFKGNLELVKLLVEQGGANINALWGDMTPLSYAIMYNKKKVEEYLRSKGALEPEQLKGEEPTSPSPSNAKKRGKGQGK